MTDVLGNERGATLMIVLVAVVVLGLAAGIAGTTWTSIMQKAREEQLMFRGDQYRRAIGSYFAAGTAAGVYPPKLEDLLKDPRYPGTVRHIRQLYPDPMTGGDWELITDPGGRIRGVRSTSTARPFKTGGFPEVYVKFENAKTYRDWEFIFQPQAGD
jgi:type II secretory pathway pseudopilin PulG